MRIGLTFTLMAALGWYFLTPRGAEALAGLLLFAGILLKLGRLSEPAHEGVDPVDGCGDCAPVSENL